MSNKSGLYNVVGKQVLVSGIDSLSKPLLVNVGEIIVCDQEEDVKRLTLFDVNSTNFIEFRRII